MEIKLGTLTDIAYNFIDDLEEDQSHEFYIQEDEKFTQVKIFFDSGPRLIHFFINGKYEGNSEY